MNNKNLNTKVKWTFLNHPSLQAIENYNKILANIVKRALLQSKEAIH